MAKSQQQFQQGLKARTSSVLGFLNRQGPRTQSPNPAPVNPNAELEALRAKNAAQRALVQAAYKPVTPPPRPPVLAKASAVPAAGSDFLASSKAYSPTFAAGTPGGPDPAMVGVGNQNPNGPGAPTINPPVNLNLPGGQLTADPLTGMVTQGEPSIEIPGNIQADALSSTSNSGVSASSISDFLQQFQAKQSSLQQQIFEASQQTTREQALQEQIDSLISSGKSGVVEAGQKTIPMEFITGQQQAIEQRANTLLEPLQRELTRAEGARTGLLGSLQQALGFQNDSGNLQLQALQEQQKPLLEASKRVQDYVFGLATKYFDAGITLTDSAESAAKKAASSPSYLAETRGEAETYTLSPGQRVLNSQGQVIAENPSSAGGDKFTNVSPGATVIDQAGNVIYRAPSADDLAGGGSTTSAAVEALNGKLTMIDSLMTSTGLKGAVGPYSLARWTPFSADAASRQDFAAGVQQLIAKDTMDVLLNLKKQGGTLGALSDQERILLQSAASKIGTWMGRDKDGNPTGKFKISEDLFKKELQTIRNLTQSALQRAGGSSGGSEGGQGDELDKVLDSLGFNPVGGVTNTAQLKELTIGKRTVRVAPSIALRLAKAANDFKQATGQDLQINQDFRSHEEQNRLYKELSAKGARVAPPGQSFHEKGMAIDVTNWHVAEPYLRRYGLVNDLADDKGHFSYLETNRRS